MLKPVKSERVPLCVKTYKQLYNMITSGRLTDKLPGENTLSQQLGVSRSTLRQALAFLHDDGLIKNIHGVGNFVIGPTEQDTSRNLEQLTNPLYQIHQENLDTHEFQFRLELDSEYTQQIFNRKSSAMVSCERWFSSGTRTSALIFTFLPISSIELLHIDMHNPQNFFKYLNETIYNVCEKSDLEIKISSAGNLRYKMPGGEQCILIIESLYKDGIVVCHNKFYIPKQFANIRLSRA